MKCFKLFQLPQYDNNIFLFDKNKFDTNIVYTRKGFIAIQVEKYSCNLILDSIKNIKARGIIFSEFILDRASSSFLKDGFNVTPNYDNDGDVSKLFLKREDYDFEIDVNGTIYMPDFKDCIIDTLIAAILGDD